MLGLMRVPLLSFFLLLPVVFSFGPRLHGESTVDPFAKWEKAISAFEEKDQQNPPPKGGIVFVGSSSIARWTTLTDDFPHYRVLNRGFGGSQLIDSVHFAERIVIPYQPRMVILYAGSNDIAAHKTPEQVFADFQAFVEKVHAQLPKTEIAYISIAGNPARWSQVEDVKKANALIEGYIKDHAGLKFINVFPHMLGSDGLPLPNIFVQDRLHMNPEGYKIWTEVITPYLPAPDR